MKIKRYDPSKELKKDWFFAPFFAPSSLISKFFEDFPEFDRESSMIPPVDVKETAEHYEIHAEVPGLSKDDLKVEIKDNLLTISGNRRIERDEEKENYHIKEMREGSFSRTFSLPQNIDISKVDAEYKNGILSLKIAKLEEEKPKTVKVKIK